MLRTVVCEKVVIDSTYSVEKDSDLYPYLYRLVAMGTDAVVCVHATCDREVYL